MEAEGHSRDAAAEEMKEEAFDHLMKKHSDVSNAPVRLMEGLLEHILVVDVECSMKVLKVFAGVRHMKGCWHSEDGRMEGRAADSQMEEKECVRRERPYCARRDAEEVVLDP